MPDPLRRLLWTGIYRLCAVLCRHGLVSGATRDRAWRHRDTGYRVHGVWA